MSLQMLSGARSGHPHTWSRNVFLVHGVLRRRVPVYMAIFCHQAAYILFFD